MDWRGRIQVVETPHRLMLTNVGGFLPGRVENGDRARCAAGKSTATSFWPKAMVNLNMIDTQGGGIKRMFQDPAAALFSPCRITNLSQPERVVVSLQGRILDERYTAC